MRSRHLLGCALGLALAFSQPANAQVKLDGISIDNFEPAIGWQNFLTVHGADVVAHGQVGAGIFFDYQRDPFTLNQCSGAIGANCSDVASQRAAIVQNGLQAYLSGAFGIKDIAQIGLGIPVGLSISSGGGTMLTPTGSTSGGSLQKTALGDLLLEGKIKLWHGPFGTGLALAPGITFPTGDNAGFTGEKTVTGRARAIFSFANGPFSGAANLGVLIRDPATVAVGDPPMNSNIPTTIDIGSQLLYGAAFAYQFPKLPRPVRAIVELFGRHGFDTYLDSAPMEGDLAVRIGLPHALSASLGGGFGIIRGVGSPSARGFIGVSWAPDYRDRDGDGVPDMDDQCPDQPEDRDGYKDEDGCPDPDNDGDGIPDNIDKCPNDAEDMDGFQDSDGCPDPDNDQDGIPDIKDACPNAAEDHRGKFPNDGCPEDVIDTDGDGIPDIKDKCPDEAEDKDGFEDADGCPDPDNDKDGVPDQYDECPNEAEDQDGFQDEDGCPDPDNDKDGILDKQDKCPNEPETINGIKDDDGCPDAGAVHVKIADNEITIDEPIVFTKAKLTHTAWLLDQLAQNLRGHDEITKLRIESHKQGGESDADAEKRATAVKEYLIKKGVGAERLAAQVVATPGPTVQFLVEARKDAKKDKK